MFGVIIRLDQIADVVLSMALGILIIRRFQRSQRRKQQLEADLRQAQQVQQMLMPEALPALPGLTIESEYRPARVVGGDFFQIIPDSRDGSVLIVLGDVTGHGLRAGMLVALLVGSIRNQVETSTDPLQMLETLNRRMYGRGDAHATCLALRITADSAATLANAGHIPPYLNGKELPMEGAMLLGMIEEAEFSVMQFHLQPGDALMLMSDGITEAQGRLFGFERIAEILRGATPQNHISAVAIATAAQDFGQEDDISVLAVTRTLDNETAIA